MEGTAHTLGPATQGLHQEVTMTDSSNVFLTKPLMEIETWRSARRRVIMRALARLACHAKR